MRRPATSPASKLTPVITPCCRPRAMRTPRCYRSVPARSGCDGRSRDLRECLAVMREMRVQRQLHRRAARARCRTRDGEPGEAVDVERHSHQLAHDLRVVDTDPELACALRVRDRLRRRAGALSHPGDDLRGVGLITEVARL